ncbi:MAG: beta-ketoacyl synthase [Pseudomonadales bacterium]|nr:beta-ketoacyl synthase [Pseudomonadales bacterium]MDP6317448.1 beta-ketoacyl synthase [Pseudomonadales bacterium]MDP7316357.1 beta-ketoacyl synthase [Pseudomonadales bacterium]MDP7577469.1 beta-ketoacyl synthase [Pseudomonadales bacterium]HJP51493.1 beta-ketoacyl synthase [Pseudomonadales bacterium]
MSRLPVIVGFGGINPAGRSSSHHAYRRLVIDRLDQPLADDTYRSLAALMNLESVDKPYILNHTLIRKIENNLFDPESIRTNKAAKLGAADTQSISFIIKRNQLPDTIPQSWQLKDIEKSRVLVTCNDNLDVLFPDQRDSRVKSGGQLPSGFSPETLYQSRNHPRGLQLTVYGASDAINSLGIDWDDVRQKIPADQISVYASSAMGQLDTNGAGGMLQASLLGKRVSARNCPLSLAEMIADFINAYVLGSVGTTGANVGACATFLYNLRQGIQDIRSGKFRAVMVGASEAPLTPEVIEGYRVMNALAEDDALNEIDGIESGPADNTRACRPFAENCGFTLSEASQFVILFDDDLAMEMGANIYGSVADVFINADGFKKSIPGPGIGNYITMGKSMGVIRSILGDDAVKHRSYIQAHGTGTPQNRVTESHIFNELAKSFGIQNWPVAAIKSYLGHSLATAAGDQIAASLGVWAHGIIPGIKTIDAVADDVHNSHLEILLDHREIDAEQIDTAFINSKGFGGNNATAAILSPHVTRQMLEKKHGSRALDKRDKLNEKVLENTIAYDAATTAGENKTIYNFGVGVVAGEELELTSDKITIPGYGNSIDLNVDNPYEDMS